MMQNKKIDSFSLFPAGSTLASLTDKEIAQKITKLLPGITKESCVNMIRDAMASSTIAWQYISFVLHQESFSMQMISKEQSLAIYGTQDTTAALYNVKLHTIMLIEDVYNLQSILHEFWHAFNHMLYLKVAPRNIAGCALEHAVPTFPFKTATFADLAFHYQKVLEVYLNLDLFTKHVEKDLANLDNLLPLSKPIRPIVKHFMPMCISINSEQLKDACLLLNSIHSAIASCKGYALSCPIPSINNLPSHLNITNPSLLDQLPKQSSSILSQLEKFRGTSLLKQADFISNLIYKGPITLLTKAEQEKAELIGLHLKLTYDCVNTVTTECDAILMQNAPLLSATPSFRNLLTLHGKEIQSHLTHCRPDIVWIPEEQVSTNIGSTMTLSFIASAIFTLSMKAVKQCAPKPTANKIQYVCTTASSFLSYCVMFQILVGDSFGIGILLGALMCHMNERLLELNSIKHIIPQPVASCLSQGASIAGLAYTADQSLATFSLSMASSITGQLVADKIFDKCFAKQTAQPQLTNNNRR